MESNSALDSIDLIWFILVQYLQVYTGKTKNRIWPMSFSIKQQTRFKVENPGITSQAEVNKTKRKILHLKSHNGSWLQYAALLLPDPPFRSETEFPLYFENMGQDPGNTEANK